MRVKRAEYAALFEKEISWKHKALGVKTRDFVTSRDKYVVEGNYFINEHHRESFMRTYPQVYAFLFEGRQGADRQVWLEFKSMYNLRGLMDSLAMYGVKRPAQGHPFVLPPSGIGRSRGGIQQIGVRGSLMSMGAF